MLLILLALCSRKPNGISHLFSIVYAFAGNGCALAHHYSRSGNTAKAIDYLHRAGQQAVERSAYAEAVSHLTSALDLLTTLPETRERSQQELAVQMTLGMVLAATKGFAAPEVAHAYTRAHALCREVGDTLGRGHLCVRPPLPGPTLAQTWLERQPPDTPDAPIAVPASRANRSQGRQTAVARTKTN
jgi:hypothetical protein